MLPITSVVGGMLSTNPLLSKGVECIIGRLNRVNSLLFGV